MGQADAQAPLEVGLIEDASEKLGEIIGLKFLELLQLLRIPQKRGRVRVGQQVLVEPFGKLAAELAKGGSEAPHVFRILLAYSQEHLPLAALTLVHSIEIQKVHGTP